MNINGLPSLPSDVNVFSNVVLLTADAILFGPGIGPQWGIFLDGAPVVLADNVVRMGFGQDWIVSEYPQELGAFASYNKAAKPFEIKLRFSTGGSVNDRQAFLQSITAIAGDTNLYDVLTPEVAYPNCNVMHVDYDRDASNAGLLSVDVWVKQISISGESTLSNTASPSDASQVNNGLVQPQPYTGANLGPLQP